MHPPINILINLNNFIKKCVNLQDITFENLSNNVIPIRPNIITKYYNQTLPKHLQSIDTNYWLP